jgi:hypothetical protein
METQDRLAGENLLLSRIALLEHRLQTVAKLVLDASRISLAPSGSPVTTIIDANSQRELAMGFHHREHNAGGEPFRWAGKADHFELRFHLERFVARPFRMTGTFVSGLGPESLSAYVDYRPIPLRIEPTDAMVVVSGRIPADPLAGTTTLTFHCRAVPPPNSIDQRLLSFAFVRLVIDAPNALQAVA